MSEKTATERLREMLDERGVEYCKHEDGEPLRKLEKAEKPATSWRTGGASVVAVPREGSELFDLWVDHCTPEQAIGLMLDGEINGETSDGYHTFNELYHHRAVLFSVIVENYRDAAWKAKKHHDGTMYDGMFIVGIDTPWGQASYHYDLDPYWDMFDCEELEAAPEWDGHTPDDAIERIGKLATLGGVRVERTCSMEYNEDWSGDELYPTEAYQCSVCGRITQEGLPDYCPGCGARVVN